MSRRKIAVVGLGAAGFQSVKALRENGYREDVDVYFKEASPLANPMLTTYYLSGKIPYEQMFPFGSPEEIRIRYRLTYHSGITATGLDRGKTLLFSDGSARRYDKILIATGAAPVIPLFCRIGSGRIFTMRTPGDAAAAAAFLERERPRHCVVIGASMAGVKVVEALEHRGIRCLLADMAARLFPLASTPWIGAEIARRLERRGVALCLGAPLNAVRDLGRVLEVTLGETTWQTDMLVLCMGTRPDVAWCQNAVDTDRGILAGDTMETSIQGVYAAGDCCQAREHQSGQQTVMGLWSNARRQGEVAGVNLAGGNRRYPGELLHNITHFMGMDFVSAGDTTLEGESAFCRARDGSWEMETIFRDGVPAACNILGNSAVGGILKAMLAKQIVSGVPGLDLMRKGLLEQQGLDRASLVRLGGEKR